MNGKLKKIAAFCLAASMLVSLSGCNDSGNNSGDISQTESNGEDNQMENKSVVLSSDNVKQVGRTYMDEQDTLWLAFSGSGAEYTFTGKKCVVNVVGDTVASQPSQVDNHTRFAIYVNGERVVDDMINEPTKQYTVIDSETETTAEIKLIKLSETAMSIIGIKPLEVEGTVTPAAAKPHKIEIIGDSITCGYGVDDEDRDHHFSTKTEDVTKSYSYKTAQGLNADYSMVSISGYGIITGYSADGETKQPLQSIPKYYDKFGFSYSNFGEDNMMSAAGIPWNHENYQADAVVINLGTNDDSWCKSKEDRCNEYKDAYIAFLERVRKAQPNAHIFCTLGVMGDALYPYVEKAVEEYSAASGDTNISAMKFDVQTPADGYAADWHPTAKTHDKASEKLIAEIKSVMGWE